jgi:ActR/RegA family two-component response regulator
VRGLPVNLQALVCARTSLNSDHQEAHRRCIGRAHVKLVGACRGDRARTSLPVPTAVIESSITLGSLPGGAKEVIMVATAARQAPAKTRPPRILVLSGDELLQHKVSRLFAEEHYQLCFKKPGRRMAVNLSGLPDAEVVLLDVSGALNTILPSLASLQEGHPDANIVVLVPQPEMYFWMEAIHLGAWECLPKPINETELKAVLMDASKPRYRSAAGRSPR